MRRLAALLAAGGCSIAGIAFAEEPLPPGADVLYSVGGRPVVFRLVVEADGTPVVRSLVQVADELFKVVDENQDGTLDDGERGRIPNRRMLEAAGLVEPTNPARTLLLRGKPAPVRTREDLRRHFDGLKIRPVQFRPATLPDARNVYFGSRIRNLRARGLKPGPALFQTLDADGDGFLTGAELNGAAPRLRRLDMDLDETATALEVFLGGDEAATTPPPFDASAAAPCQAIDAGADEATFASQCCRLLQAAGSVSGGGFLARPDAAMPDDAFAELDANRDAVIDPAEWSALRRRPPEFVLRPDHRVSAPRAEVHAVAGAANALAALPTPAASDPPAGRKDGPRHRFGRLEIGGRWKSNPAHRASAKRTIEQRFAASDQDKNGYLDRGELGQFPGADLRDVDPDGDGMVFEKELAPVLLPLYTLTSQLVRVTVDESGFDLFEAADTTADGRLTSREVAGLPALVGGWDRDGDGKVGRDELPRVVSLTVELGERDTAYYAPTAGQTLARSVNREQAWEAAPGWFKSMDQNYDLAVSRREFLGPLETFADLDADGDGLLSVDEAKAGKK